MNPKKRQYYEIHGTLRRQHGDCAGCLKKFSKYMLNKYMKCSVSGTTVLYIGPAEVKG